MQLTKNPNNLYVLPGETRTLPTKQNIYGRIKYDVHDILGFRVHRCWTNNLYDWRISQSMELYYQNEITRTLCRQAIGEWMCNINNRAARVVSYAWNCGTVEDYIQWASSPLLAVFVKTHKGKTLDKALPHVFRML